MSYELAAREEKQTTVRRMIDYRLDAPVCEAWE